MKGQCTTPECPNQVQCAGFCRKCYNRNHRAGTLFPHPPHVKAINSAIANKRPLGHRRMDNQGYINIQTETGVRQEHRVIMETVVGRPLLRTETVHHKNGIRDDNRIENLELWQKAQPYGQRAEDLISYVVEHHTAAVEAALQVMKVHRTADGQERA